MKHNFKILLILLLVLSTNFGFAQEHNFLIFKKLTILQEVVYEAQIDSKSGSREVRMPNGKTFIANSIGGLRKREHSMYSEILIKPSKTATDVIVNFKRFKNNERAVEIDTDSPFTTDLQTQASLDFYTNKLGNQPKISFDKIESQPVKPLESTAWGGPLLNPIHELSDALFPYSLSSVEIGKYWTDTINGNFNSYINSYKVLEIGDNEVIVSIEGELRKIIPQSLIQQETVDLEALVKSTNKIESTTIIDSAKYKGKMVILLNNLLISEMTLNLKKQESTSIFGTVNQKTIDLNCKVSNKVL